MNENLYELFQDCLNYAINYSPWDVHKLNKIVSIKNNKNTLHEYLVKKDKKNKKALKSIKNY